MIFSIIFVLTVKVLIDFEYYSFKGLEKYIFMYSVQTEQETGRCFRYAFRWVLITALLAKLNDQSPFELPNSFKVASELLVEMIEQ
jgi:hypothetical protein